METPASLNAEKCISHCQVKAEYRSLISALSHEVKNQLSLISSSLQLVAKECPEVSDLSLWPQIQQELQEAICLLKDASACMQSEQIHPTSFPVIDFLDRISASFSPLMQEKAIHFETAFAESLKSEIISADALKLKEAVSNLLLNAADAVSERDAFRRIILSAHLEDAKLCIHVKDNGPGIPQEYMKTLFDPFVTHKCQGTGLGLTITKNIVEQHCGTITVSTCTALPDTYTDFLLQIPILRQ